jgi:phosphotransacetylase
LAPVSTAVVYPCEAHALTGAIDAWNKKLIVPILVGPASQMAATAESANADLGGLQIVDVPDCHAAAEKAVELIHEGRAEALMKGSLHTDVLMSVVVSHEGGLRTGRRISHAFLMDVPTYHKVLIVTDGAINIALCWKTSWTFARTQSTWRFHLAERGPKWRFSPRSKR